ncbi:hypothetical protein BZA77DRAFT_350979 [Pyronema omphalodes]|nr:hypothetical protein BZA77DRAFT_350979 [Pyronema omphalodes]
MSDGENELAFWKHRVAYSTLDFPVSRFRLISVTTCSTHSVQYSPEPFHLSVFFSLAKSNIGTVMEILKTRPKRTLFNQLLPSFVTVPISLLNINWMHPGTNFNEVPNLRYLEEQAMNYHQTCEDDLTLRPLLSPSLWSNRDSIPHQREWLCQSIQAMFEADVDAEAHLTLWGIRIYPTWDE